MFRILIFVFFLSNVLSGSPRTSVDDPEVFEKIKPYLLPENYQTTDALNQIFFKKGVLSSVKTLEKAGFQLICNREGRGLIVAHHPFLKGFLLKVYLDDLKHSEWTRWVRRAKGAAFVQAVIDENKNHKKYFKVPKKWIYILPKDKRGNGDFPRESVLLVEDMTVLSKEASRELYKVLWSYNGLDALYTVLQKSGFSDGHVDNLPFSTDHKIAFIDTEFTNKASVHFDWLTKWFAASKQRYWEALIEQGGPEVRE